MNSPEWITILIGCITCSLNGMAQSFFAILFAEVVNVTNVDMVNFLRRFFVFRLSKIVHILNDTMKC